jgi:flagellar biosynthesis/type III secretory pathway protein FliH
MSSESKYLRFEQASTVFVDFYAEKIISQRAFDDVRPVDSVEDQAHAIYAKGYATGLQQARQDFKQLEQSQLQEILCDELLILHAAQAKLVELQGWFVESSSAELLRLALEIAKRMTRMHLTSEVASVLPIVEEALRTFPAFTRSLRIRVHPLDLLRIQGLFKHETENRSVSLHSDETIELGGCVVSSETNDLDATNQQRWTKICDILDQECPWIQSKT